jgi:transposase
MKGFVEGDDRRLWGLRAWATGRPAYHPATMLKIYVYGYVNQIVSSRRLEREA